MFPKARFQKKRNDEETQECVSSVFLFWWLYNCSFDYICFLLNLSEWCIPQWVNCERCNCWQHQICALFNDINYDVKQAYTCLYCYIEEVKRGLHVPSPQSAVLGASDLPRTALSDHIEERLFKRLKLERQARAVQTGRSFDEVSETKCWWKCTCTSFVYVSPQCMAP